MTRKKKSSGVKMARGTEKASKVERSSRLDRRADIDMASLDPKRYGDWMTTEYAARKNEEASEHV